MNEEPSSQNAGMPGSDAGAGPIDPDSPASQLEASKTHARLAAEELRQAATLKAQQLRHQAEHQVQHLRTAAEERAEQLRHAATDTWSEARHRAQDARSELERYVQEKPATALLTAFGIGLFLGLILRR